MLTFTTADGPVPLAEHYASVFAHHLGYTHTFGHVYEPAYGPRPPTDSRFAPAVYGFRVNVKVFTRRQMLDLYLDSEPLLGTPMIHCRMVGEKWPDDVLSGLCQAVNELPYGLEVSRVLLEQADWLDAHPEYRGVPGLARRHDDKRTDRLISAIPTSPRDWE